MVGAVITRDGQELSRGWHKRFGGLHAEREALQAARLNGVDVRGATMYVTLEPCCHHGKTPPCTEAILESGISRVVVAMTDPDTRVAGNGLAILREGGLEVVEGVCQVEAESLLAAYIKLRTRQRPWVICKWAQTEDGYLALPPDQGRWITGKESRQHVHEVRSWCDGILVGVQTVLADDPMLNNRSGKGKQPVRIVLDSRLRIPADCQLVRTAREFPVLVATTVLAVEQNPQAVANLEDYGVEILAIPSGGAGVDLAGLLDELGQRQWTYLLVEGGAKVLESFVTQGLTDELLAYVAPITAGKAEGDLPRFDIHQLAERLAISPQEQLSLGQDTLSRFLL